MGEVGGEGAREGGGTQCSISHRPTAAAFSAEREKEEGGLRGVRQCVRSVF